MIIAGGCILFFTSCSGTFFFEYGYNVKDGKVYYKNAFPGGTSEIEGADAKTFKVIFQPGDPVYNSNKDFAVDKNHVYWAGGPIEGSDGNSFVILDRNFSKDKGQCYFHGKLVPGADPNSFTIKDEIFSADKSNIYRRTELMDTSSAVFESFDSSYIVRTANTVSALDLFIPIEQGATFTYLKFNYFAIDGQVYFQGKPVEGVNMKGFRPLDDWFYQTPEHVYYGERMITGADPVTFKLLQSPYSSDKDHVFFFERTIPAAEPGSFEIINIKFQCARDKHAAWNGDVKIKNVTAADLENKKECIQCNETHLYFAEK